MTNLLFIDSSAYLSLLNPQDSNHQQAVQLAKKYNDFQPVTSYNVLGELATVGSMRFDKETTLRFIESIKQSSTLIVCENQSLMRKTLLLFKQVTSKNISWVDCYSRVIMNEYGIDHIFTFDHNFVTLSTYALPAQP